MKKFLFCMFAILFIISCKQEQTKSEQASKEYVITWEDFSQDSVTAVEFTTDSCFVKVDYPNGNQIYYNMNQILKIE